MLMGITTPGAKIKLAKGHEREGQIAVIHSADLTNNIFNVVYVKDNHVELLHRSEFYTLIM